MSNEDLTTYTEYDPNAKIAVTSTRSTFTAIEHGYWNHLVKDFGANFFDGNFTHDFDVYFDDCYYLHDAGVVVWALTQEEDDWVDLFNANKLFLALILWSNTTSKCRLELWQVYSTSSHSIITPLTALDADTLYYVRVRRDESIGTYGRLYLNIYSNAERDSMAYPQYEDTFYLDIAESKEDFRYFYPTAARDDTGSPPADTWITGYSQNYNLAQEYATPTTKSLTLTGYAPTLWNIGTLRYSMGDVNDFVIRRGRNHPLDKIETGTCTVKLNNFDGDYWPDNVSSPYYPTVRPKVLLLLRWVYGGTSYGIFTGLVEGFEFGFLDPIIGSVVTLECSDVMENLAKVNINSAGYSQELSGTRVQNVLGEITWDTDKYNLDAGEFNMAATGTLSNTNALTHLNDVQVSEGGLFFVDGEGWLNYQDRAYRANPTSLATFGDNVADQKGFNAELSYDATLIYNDIRLTRTGGTEQVAQDSTSIALYGKRTYQQTGLLLTSDALVMQQAQYLLSRYKTPRLRVKSLTIRPQADEANLFPKVLTYEISDCITVRLTDASIFERYFIEGITHSWNAKSDLWETVWDLSPVAAFELILDTVSLTLTGKAPVLGTPVSPTTLALTITTYIPYVDHYQPTKKALAITTYIPTVTNGA